jgi:alpha-galactosidase
VQRQLQEIFGVDKQDIQARVAGINHLAWMLDLKINGQEALPQLRELAGQIIADGGREFGPQDKSSMIDRALVKSRLLQIYGALPAAGDRHVAEFFPFFLTDEAGRGKKYGLERSSVQERQQWHEADERFIHSLLNDEAKLASFMQHTSGEASNEIIVALATNGSFSDVMNLPNRGQIANLPPGVVVETQAVVDGAGAHGLCAGKLPPGVHAVVARHVANQEMIVQAAITGDRELALQALLNDPMVHHLDSAAPMLDELLAANELFLTKGE